MFITPYILRPPLPTIRMTAKTAKSNEYLDVYDDSQSQTFNSLSTITLPLLFGNLNF